ncbi:MAG: hypothetical protein ABH834_00315 [Candidatus Altiarchaeota archaeon]
MKKKTCAVFAVLILVFSAGCFEDPQASKARRELSGVQAEYDYFEARVDELPSLSLSAEVRADLDVEIYSLEVLASAIPGEKFDTESLIRLLGALQERDSQDISSGFDSPDELFGELLKFEEVFDDDLTALEKKADLFDSLLDDLKDEEDLSGFPVKRIDATEKYFTQYELLVERHASLKKVVDSYSSTRFRARIEELRKANRAHGRFLRFITRMDEIGFINPRLSDFYPDLAGEEAALMACVGKDANESYCQGAQAWQYTITPLANALKKELEALKD